MYLEIMSSLVSETKQLCVSEYKGLQDSMFNSVLNKALTKSYSPDVCTLNIFIGI